MRKLKLDIEALQIESFEALPTRAQRGTVAGYLYENMEPLYQDPWYDGGGGGGAYTVGTCIGPTYCCADTWNCPVIDTNTASRVVSAINSP
ncbi:MAG TPA: hypothetical protein VJT67_06745, partial [Longimicrobiaceae bacterium]|nr:hypothetical protein [Longimicrobiaceae bacterium]